MSTNAFNIEGAPEKTLSDTAISKGSFLSRLPSGTFFSEDRLMLGGGIILGIGVFFFIISSFSGESDSGLKASLSNSAGTFDLQNPAGNQQNGGVVETEIVYKDQYGNILTDEQVQNALHPTSTPTPIATSSVATNEAERAGVGVKYPKIEITAEEKERAKNVLVDTTKAKLYVKEGDAAKLLKEKRLVRKIVDNRPLWVEPLTGAVVELIKPIERPLAKRVSLVSFTPPLIDSSFLKESSSEIKRSSSEIGRLNTSSFVSTPEASR